MTYELVYIFFFQAEDGIRDYKVTGVQTCALPILIYEAKGLSPEAARKIAAEVMADAAHALDTLAREELGINPQELGGSAWEAASRSEERRVGEEGRSRWSADHLKKKKSKKE